MSIESEHDLEALRRVGRVVAETIAAARARLCPGMTTAEVDGDRRGGLRAATARAPRRATPTASRAASASRSTTRPCTGSPAIASCARATSQGRRDRGARRLLRGCLRVDRPSAPSTRAPSACAPPPTRRCGAQLASRGRHAAARGRRGGRARRRGARLLGPARPHRTRHRRGRSTSRPRSPAGTRRGPRGASRAACDDDRADHRRGRPRGVEAGDGWTIRTATARAAHAEHTRDHDDALVSPPLSGAGAHRRARAGRGPAHFITQRRAPPDHHPGGPEVAGAGHSQIANSSSMTRGTRAHSSRGAGAGAAASRGGGCPGRSASSDTSSPRVLAAYAAPMRSSSSSRPAGRRPVLAQPRRRRPRARSPRRGAPGARRSPRPPVTRGRAAGGGGGSGTWRRS